MYEFLTLTVSYSLLLVSESLKAFLDGVLDGTYVARVYQM